MAQPAGNRPVWQLVTLRAGRRLATAGDFFRLVQRPWPVRVVVLAGWLGWHFFVRGSW